MSLIRYWNAAFRHAAQLLENCARKGVHQSRHQLKGLENAKQGDAQPQGSGSSQGVEEIDELRELFLFCDLRHVMGPKEDVDLPTQTNLVDFQPN